MIKRLIITYAPRVCSARPYRLTAIDENNRQCWACGFESPEQAWAAGEHHCQEYAREAVLEDQTR